jgi:hypothetical protein
LYRVSDTSFQRYGCPPFPVSVVPWREWVSKPIGVESPELVDLAVKVPAVEGFEASFDGVALVGVALGKLGGCGRADLCAAYGGLRARLRTGPG